MNLAHFTARYSQLGIDLQTLSSLERVQTTHDTTTDISIEFFQDIELEPLIENIEEVIITDYQPTLPTYYPEYNINPVL